MQVFAAQLIIQGGGDGLSYLTPTSTLITTFSGTGGAHTFTGLEAGDYFIGAVYDNDGTHQILTQLLVLMMVHVYHQTLTLMVVMI